MIRDPDKNGSDTFVIEELNVKADSIVFTECGSIAVTCNEEGDRFLQVWKNGTWKKAFGEPLAIDSSSLDSTKDGFLLCKTYYSSLSVFNIDTGNLARQMELPFDFDVVRYSDDEKLIACLTTDEPRVHIVDAVSGKERYTLPQNTNPLESEARFLAWSGSRIAAASGSTINVWHLDKSGVFREFTFSENPVPNANLVFAEDLLIAVDTEGGARFYDLKNGETVFDTRNLRTL